MKKITAKYEGVCMWCQTRIHEGQEIYWERGEGAGHINCKPSHSPSADREYYLGMQDGEKYLTEVAIYGRELADRFAMEDEFARWNRGEDW